MNSENLSELTQKALLKVRQKLLDLSKRSCGERMPFMTDYKRGALVPFSDQA